MNHDVYPASGKGKPGEVISNPVDERGNTLERSWFWKPGFMNQILQ
jgi:hypothetical protein